MNFNELKANDLISIIGVIINILLLVFYIVQVIALKKQIANDVEKAKSDTTLNVLLAWTNNLTSNMTRSRKIVEQFTLAQCEKLRDCEKFSVSSSIHKEICLRMGKEYRDAPNSEYSLTDEEINALRDDCVRYLNLLEVVLLSRKYSTSNHDDIEIQFRYLVMPEKKNSVLQNLRIAFGGKNSYPAIEDFCNKIMQESGNQK